MGTTVPPCMGTTVPPTNAMSPDCSFCFGFVDELLHAAMATTMASTMRVRVMTSTIERRRTCGNDTATVPDSGCAVRLHESPPHPRLRTCAALRGIAIAEVLSKMRHPTDTEAFSAIEEEFFREGEAMSESPRAEREVSTAPQRSVWSRLFARTPRAVTEPSI